ncbi:uncharacterized protein [Triticum aestivum]|uniref:uncharacterized protein n=1 Tax=Triticum aestivum TaxID=4565 RepID=UPI001D00FCEB|nr:uncharacterized protein LOC123147187 [Triticum aestivum]
MLLPVHQLPASLRPPSSCARAGSPTSAAPRASSAPGRDRRVVAVLPAAGPLHIADEEPILRHNSFARSMRAPSMAIEEATSLDHQHMAVLSLASAWMRSLTDQTKAAPSYQIVLILAVVLLTQSQRIQSSQNCNLEDQHQSGKSSTF